MGLNLGEPKIDSFFANH